MSIFEDAITKLKAVVGPPNHAEPKPIRELLPMLTRRAERLNSVQQAETFVAIGGLEQALLNTDSRVIFGRRGTGKTHVLSYIADTARKRHDLAIQIDLRTVGSNSYLYSSENVPLPDRAAALLRDFITAVHDALLEEVTAPKSPVQVSKIAPLIDRLGAPVAEVSVRETYESKSEEHEKARQASSGSVAGKVAALGSAMESSGKVEVEKSGEAGATIIERGSYRLSINAGSVHRALSDIAGAAGVRIWVLVDEWATVPDPLQPYLADLIKRSFLPHAAFSVSIASIEQRSNFRLQAVKDTIGFELGSDLFADLNLDDYLVFENSPTRSLTFFKQMLFRHLRSVAQGALAEKDADEFIRNAFTQEPTFRELVRASEGVPRDAINILQIAAIRAENERISIPNIRDAAKDWYDRDKAAHVNETPEANALLSWITKEVIAGRKARAFLLKSDVKDAVLERLFDERLLHIAKRSYSAKAYPGTRYRVWKLDYGCYVDRFNTSAAPTGFIFEDQEVDDTGMPSVPEDDLRAIRRAVLDLHAFHESQAQDKSQGALAALPPG